MLSHANLLDTARMYIEALEINETHALYQFLPLAHVMARVAQAVVLSAGARICYWGGDAGRIIDELAELEPTHFPAVPRVYEKIHGAVLGQVQDGPALQRAIFGWALQRGKRARTRVARRTDAQHHREPPVPTGRPARPRQGPQRLRRRAAAGHGRSAPASHPSCSSSLTPAACSCSKATG